MSLGRPALSASKTDQNTDQDIDRGAELTVTVGIPVLNGEKTIEQSIDSVLAQTHQDVCVWISDNASTDRTQDICLSKAGDDSRVNYFQQERNIGVFGNYNAVFLKCESKYFKWQSSSDWCEPDFIEVCVDILESDPTVVLVCPSVLLVRESGDTQPYSDDFDLMMDNPADRFRYLLQNIKLCNLFNGVIRSDALRRSVLNRDFLGSDVVLLADLALKGKFVLIPQRLWHRRLTPETSSVLKSGEDRAEFFSGLPSDYESRGTWKTIASLAGVILRSDVGAADKMSCFFYLLKMARWKRRELWRELIRKT